MSDAAQDFAAMRTPAAEHEKLAAFAGTFKARVSMWMGPGEPMISTGTMVNELDLGGLFLKQTYTGDPNEGPFPEFEGRGFWGYNKFTNRYEGFWIDNASSMMQTEAGELDESGRVWTMTGELPDPSTGGTMTKRSVITLQDGDNHLMEMYFDTGEGETKSMEIQYTRA
ncbi:MAG: DUF1579 domain-containing protein [Thermoanaerobaculia bacterium]